MCDTVVRKINENRRKYPQTYMFKLNNEVNTNSTVYRYTNQT